MLVVSASLLSGTSAFAQTKWPFVGKWALDAPKACEPGSGPSDLFLTITDKKLSYYASECVILSKRRIAKSGDDAYRLKLRCTGEGQTSQSELILGLLEKTEERSELLVHIDPVAWSMTGYRRCSE
ncbi:MAG: hypothetical protein JWN71_1735 [Xanthobacteraceae bacterium]|nr:hypothetical protein [Xanthobacteraceae bacterium]